MSKMNKKVNSTRCITIGTEVFECSEYNYNQYNFLTKNGTENVELFKMILEDEELGIGGCTIQKLRKFLVNNNTRGNVSLEDLQTASTREELYELIDELFVQKFPIGMLEEIFESFTIEDIWNYRKNNGLRNPVSLLTFNVDYAKKHFCLN